ncbi:hypothetical protein NDK47_26520 [Brevibacillus ruminantium]|uniref:Glycosyltransferase RgtA/B/C/D-like domain-containing protein n=1 Tax=Brevibacillus ruminantium TaxID=2950604 RepID=A0ABY4WHW2_9BACL|nr:hypothetical protein [Brevibacillus ruminantium]USG65612.1 hypothetical protein NDK47_26520 [Brevibacillus ruminantium]
MNQSINRNKSVHYFSILGITLILFLAFMLLFTSLLLLCGVPIMGISLWLSVGLGLICLWGMARSFFPARTGAMFFSILLGLAVVLGISWYVSAHTYDMSWDGQTYHQEAIILLTDGWNPAHELLEAPSDTELAKLQGRELLSVFHLWINHYSKGPWLLDSLLYKVTNQIEVSKIFNFILMFASFFLSVAALLTAFPQSKRRAVLVSLLLACNPVVFTQLITFYIDGQLSSLILCLCALGYLLFQRFHPWLLVGLCAAIMLLGNVKFTALVYAVLLSGGLLLLFYLYDRRRNWRKLAVTLAACFFLSVVIVGYNPYVINTLTKAHPFYPLAGEQAVDIMTSNSPRDFLDKNQFEKLLISTFAMTANVANDGESQWKLPFSVSPYEVAAFTAPDVRLGGFGPVFGGAVLISFIVFLGVCLCKRETVRPFFVILGIFMISILINPESWWARYVPQLWSIPLLIAVMGLESGKKWLQNGSRLLICTLLANMLMVGLGHLAGQSYSHLLLKKQLHAMKQSNQPVLVDFRHFNSNRIRLQEAGIPFIEMKIDDQNAKGLSSSRTLYLIR